jgi:hypothetical protein
MSIYTELARQSLEHYLKHKTYLAVPKKLPDELMKRKRGVFVAEFLYRGMIKRKIYVAVSVRLCQQKTILQRK